MFDFEKVLNKNCLKDILKQTTEYDIYSYYIGKQFEIGRVMKSPLRKESHPSFGVFKSTTSGDLLWKDQATGKTGNIVTFVSELFNINNTDAINKIYEEVVKKQIILITEKGSRIRDSYEKVKTIISIQRKNFTETDDKYWGQYLISREILKKHNVFPIQTFWINDQIANLFYTKKQPLYAYIVGDKYQIYSPYGDKKNKFRTNCNIGDIHGLEQLPDKGNLLIITKSKKDIIVLDRLGYNAIAPLGETTPIPDEIISDLKNRFKKIIVLYDNDEPGIKAATKFSLHHDLRFVYIPKEYYIKFGIKDVSDFIKAYKIIKTKELLKKLFTDENG